MTETQLQAKVFKTLGSRSDVRIFRNEVGAGWVGQRIDVPGFPHPQFTVLRHARRVTFGLHDGSSDLIGFRRIFITPNHVGRHLAIFLGAEVKTPSGRIQPNQENWHEFLRDSGGISIIARDSSPEYIASLLQNQP